ncbi:MAG: iron ABC transporter permease [Planctomycetales bacterium]|nr:iron ABC transporter permease [Planctomycetales bacterium]
MSNPPSLRAKNAPRIAVLCLVAACVAYFACDNRMRGLLARTLWLALASNAIALPLGTVWGAAIAKIDVAGRRWLTAILGGMLLAPLALQAGAWQAACGAGGWLVQFFDGRPYSPGWLQGTWGAIWVHGMAAVPWTALFVAQALATAPGRWEEEALLDAPSWRVIWKVSLPRAVGGWGPAALWTCVVCSSEISVTDFFLTTAAQNTFAEEIYNVAALGGIGVAGTIGPQPALPRSGGSLSWESLALGCTAVAFAVWAGLLWCTERSQGLLSTWDRGRWQWLPRRRWATTSVAWSIALLAALIPLASLVEKVGWTTGQGGGTPRSWSLLVCLERIAASPWLQRREWGWSLAMGAGATLLAVIVGFAAAWFTRGRRRLEWVCVAATAAVLAIPGPLWGEAVVMLFSRPADSAWSWLGWLYDRTLAAPILAQAWRAVPLATLALWSAVRQMPDELVEATRSDGAGAWARLRRLGVPMCRPALVAAGVLAMASSMGELSATLLTLPPGATPLSVRLFGLLHYGVDDRASAICLTMWGFCALLAMAAMKWGDVVEVRGEGRQIE